MRFRQALLIQKQNQNNVEYEGDTIYNNYLPENHKKVIVAKDAIQVTGSRY